MNTGVRTMRQLASHTGNSICQSCRETLSRKTYATAAAAVAQNETQAQLSQVPPVTFTTPQQAYQVKAGVVLSRPPLITRDLHPFEKAYFLYQRRLNERSALPFTRYFYFKKKTPADIEWKRKVKQRLTPARDIGRYSGYGAEAWNDEVLVGAQESEPDWQVEKLLEDAEQPATEVNDESLTNVAIDNAKKSKEEPIERPMPRVTEADKKHDVKSLDRLLQRTLYLLVKNKEGLWQFPDDRLIGRENLHSAAERVLVQSGGINMNTWLVGNHPIGHHNWEFEKPVSGAHKIEELGERIFFLKARIMAGQADLTENKFGLKDFQWLAKEEVQQAVRPGYWSSVRNMLAER